MARLVFGMNQSLDGYVDHMAFAPGPTLFRHFIEEAQRQAGSVYGREMYQVMRYWDDEHPEWDAGEQAFAAAWRNQPKWVVSRSLTSVGPNARLIKDELDGAIRKLKAERDGEIEVAGPNLAQSLTELGLIDEYRIYLHPRDRLLTALSSAWLIGSILTLGVPLSMVIERHFSLRIKLTAYIMYMIAWCLVPAVLLALGALPCLGRKATMRARGATAL
jgi:dihydrofolate reductase